HTLGNDPNLAFHIYHVGREIEPKDLHTSGSRRHQPREHLYGRRFPSAVRPEEAIELPSFDPKVYVLNGREIAKTAGKVLSEDCGFHKNPSLPQHWGNGSPTIGPSGDPKGYVTANWDKTSFFSKTEQKRYFCSAKCPLP